MKQRQAGRKSFYNNFPRYLLSDVTCLCYVFRKCARYCTGIVRLATNIPALLTLAARMLAMPLSPLRRIILRELSIYHPDPRNNKYSIYSLIDTMECGHSQEMYLFEGLQAVTNAYISNPAVMARRHRCRPCASLLAKKRPQSVPFTAITKMA